MRRIVLKNLPQSPPANTDYSQYKYLVFDGKFLFGRKYSLLTIYDPLTNKPVVVRVARGENRAGIIPWLKELKSQGLNPRAVTTDGLWAGIYSFKEVWPDILTQRCLFHIKLQVNAWTRIPPRTELGKDLSMHVNRLFYVENILDARQFRDEYLGIVKKHKTTINNLDNTTALGRDLRRAVSVLEYAQPNLFHYLNDP